MLTPSLCLSNICADSFSVGIMMDTEGSEVHTSAFDQPIKAEAGEEYVFTIRNPASVTGAAIGVSYDAFVDDVEVCLSLN